LIAPAIALLNSPIECRRYKHNMLYLSYSFKYFHSAKNFLKKIFKTILGPINA